MPTKHNPRWDWTQAGSSKLQPFTAQDFESLAKVLKVRALSKEVQEQLTEATHDYFIFKRLYDASRPSEMKPALEKVRDTGMAFADCLKRLDSHSREKLALGGIIPFDPERATPVPVKDMEGGEQEATLRHPKSVLEMIDRASVDTKGICKAANRALSQLKTDTGGRPSTKKALREYITQLTTVFQEVTGTQATNTYDDSEKEKYGGLFYVFVYTCIKIVNPDEFYSNNALGEQIKLALRLI